MEFLQRIKTKIGNIWISNATENGLVKFEGESRQKFEAQFLREVLCSINENYELEHELNGAPTLKNHPHLHISISHSDQWFAVYISEQFRVGIDIEIQSSGIDKAKKLFLNEWEISNLQLSEDHLKIAWGIKESVFKMCRGDIRSLSKDIRITSIRKNQAEAFCKNQKINLQFQQSDTFTLVYTN